MMDHPKDEILIDLLLDELNESEARAVREHLETCDDCSERVRKLMSTLSVLDEFAEVEPSRSIKQNVMAELGFMDKSKIKVFPSRGDIFEAAQRRQPVLRFAAAAAVLLFGIYIWQIIAPKSFMSQYGIEVMNARLEAPSTVQPNATIPISLGIWDETGEMDAIGGSRDVTIELTANDQPVISRIVSLSPGEIRSEDIDLKGIKTGLYGLKASVKGNELVSTSLMVEKSIDIKLDLDRPIYRPGEEIRLRVQARYTGGAAAKDENAIFVLRDPLDGLVTHQMIELDKYGVAQFKYPLADLVPIGEYLAIVRIDHDEIQKKIFVDDYRKPKFKVEMESERDFLTLNDVFKANVKSEYFFGKPVSDADVKIEWHVSDSGILRQMYTGIGETNDQGEFSFIFKPVINHTFSKLDDSTVIESYLSISITDSIGREESLVEYLPLARYPVQVRFFAENGRIIRLMENKIYLITTDPTGRPVSCDLELKLPVEWKKLATSEGGIASFGYTPIAPDQYFDIKVEPNNFEPFLTGTILSTVDSGDPYKARQEFILRSINPVYEYGENIDLEIIVPSFYKNSVRLDLYRDDTWLASKEVEIRDEVTRVSWQIPPVSGELTIEGSLSRGIESQTRLRTLIIVNEPDDINIDVTLDSNSYQPGSMVKADISVDRGGESRQASLGVNVSDKSLIEAGKKAETTSKIISDTVLAGLEKGVMSGEAKLDDQERQNLARAYLSSQLSVESEKESLNAVSTRIPESEIKAGGRKLSAAGNFPFVFTRVILVGLLYAGVVLAGLTSIINIARARKDRLPVGQISLLYLKTYSIVTFITLLVLTTSIAAGSTILLAGGFVLTLVWVNRLVRCLQRNELVANVSTFAFILSVGATVIAALMIAHQGIWKPELVQKGSLHPFLDISLITLLVLTGCFMIISALFIPRLGGEPN